MFCQKMSLFEISCKWKIRHIAVYTDFYLVTPKKQSGGGVLFLTQAWVLLKWKFTQAHI